MEIDNLTPEQKEIGNRKIAEFLDLTLWGFKMNDLRSNVLRAKVMIHQIDEYIAKGYSIQYPSTYDWHFLIACIEKIEAMHKGMAFEVVIRGICCEIKQSTQHWIVFGDTGRYYEGDVDKKGKVIKVIIDLPEIDERAETKVVAVWLAVIQFIDWYNSQSKEVKKLCNL